MSLIMSTDLVQLMEENLRQVWSERNADRRRKALEGIYAKDSILFEVGEKISGFDAINDQVSNIVNALPKEFIFTRLKPVIINNNIGRLIWGIGPKGQPPVTTGMDIAVFENGRIKSLYVFLDK
jgi:hypothetical protein